MLRYLIALVSLAALGRAAIAADKQRAAATNRIPVTGREAMLMSKIDVHFEGVSIKEAIERLHHQTKINMVMDMAAIRNAGIDVNRQYSLDLHETRVNTVLFNLLNGAKLAHVVRNDVVVITTLENARGPLKRVTYPVAELIVPVPNCEVPATPARRYLMPAEKMARQRAAKAGAASPASVNRTDPAVSDVTPRLTEAARNANILIDLIVKTIAPDTWDANGGNGTITYSPKDLSLIVNQAPDIQEQVQDLICTLNRQFKEIAFEAKLVEVIRGRANKVSQMPKVTFFDEQTCYVSTMTMRTAAPNVGVGLAIQLRTETVAPNRVRIEMTVKDNRLDTTDGEGIAIVGQTVQSTRTVTLERQTRLVLERDSHGAPRKWLEFILHQVIMQEEPEVR